MEAILSLIILLMAFKPVHDLIGLLAEHTRMVALDRMYMDNRDDLKKKATMFKNIVASLNGCTSPESKQRCIDDHADFIENFARTIASSNSPRSLCGSVVRVLVFQQRLITTKSIPNLWIQEFADAAYQSLMVCAHAAFIFGEIKSDDMIDDLSNAMYAFTRLHSMVKQERLKNRNIKAA